MDPRALYERSDDAGDFAAYLQSLRDRYTRLLSLIAAVAGRARRPTVVGGSVGA